MAGTYNTQDTGTPNPTNEMTQSFARDFDAIPRIPVGLSHLNIDCSHNIRIQAGASEITQESFLASLNAWGDTILYAAGMTFLVADSDLNYLQSGTFSTLEVGSWQNPKMQNSKQVNFTTPFDGQTPKVICWLTGVDMDNNKNWRCNTYATDIDANGFTVHIDSWGDTIMYSASMTWLAYPANQPNVDSGSFSTQDIRPWNKFQQLNSAPQNFTTGFDKVPNLAVAINSFDYDSSKDLLLLLSTPSESQTATGFTWQLDSWNDAIMYSAAASYFAWIW